MNWDYGDSWEKFPIKPQEVWKAGDNRVVCADITKISPRDMLELLPNKAEMVYIDLPYNQSAMSSYRTKAGEGYAEFNQFLNKVLAVTRAHCGRVAYFEIGLKSCGVLQKLLGHWFGVEPTVFRTTYYKKAQCNLVRVALDRSQAPFNFDKMDDERTPHYAMAWESPKSVADFCCSRGLTGRSAFFCKIPFFGVELNQRRLANLLEFYASHGLPPVFERRIEYE